jgi:uncharacterized membrane protein YphA (DoxX/SURF4 family)
VVKPVADRRFEIVLGRAWLRLLGGVMPAWLEQNPVWVNEVLHWQWILFAARLALTSPYLLGGFTKLLNFPAAIAEQEQYGLRPGGLWAAVTIFVELGGSLLILSSYLVWLGAGALGCLTAVAMLKADNFWSQSGKQRLAKANTFFEHLGLVAGFVLIAIIYAG